MKQPKNPKNILMLPKSKSNVSSSEFNINPGLTSILLIFAVLCLVSFAVLTYVSANSDKKLNDKVLSRTTEYYKACNTAQGVISQIDNELEALYRSCSGSEDYFEEAGTYRSFFVEVNDTQNLYVTIDILYPTDADSGFYSIKEWYVENINRNAIIIED